MCELFKKIITTQIQFIYILNNWKYIYVYVLLVINILLRRGQFNILQYHIFLGAIVSINKL